MIFRKISFVVVILFFAAIAVFMVADLIHTEKKIDKQKKEINKKKNGKANSKKSYYH